MYCKTEPFPLSIFIYFVAYLFSFVVCFSFVYFILFRLDFVLYAYHLLLRLIFLRGDKFRTLLSILFLSYSIRLKWLSIFETESILLRTSLCSESNASNSYRSFSSSRSLLLRSLRSRRIRTVEIFPRSAPRSSPLNPERRAICAVGLDLTRSCQPCLYKAPLPLGETLLALISRSRNPSSHAPPCLFV